MFVVHCAGCGEDCSHAYGTWHGDAYHIGCIPGPSKKQQSHPCTCHPDDNPPVPCPRKYALSECRAAARALSPH